MVVLAGLTNAGWMTMSANKQRAYAQNVNEFTPESLVTKVYTSLGDGCVRRLMQPAHYAQRTPPDHARRGPPEQSR